MKKKASSGWFHTGTDSFDSPKIEYWRTADAPMNFAWGPFKTYKAAIKDFKRMITSDIRNLQELYDGILRLERKEK